MLTHIYLTHPQVNIDPSTPVPDWSLSDRGRGRLNVLLSTPRLKGVSRIVCSGERKAIETAEIIGRHLNLSIEIREETHENDRSATGFLPPPEFEKMADAFFGRASESIRGWERAVDAQARIVNAVASVIAEQPGTPTLFSGHGGVGTLLLCHIAGLSIARIHDQPAGGGNMFAFSWSPRALVHGWVACDTLD